jgi:hypothetical protein
MKVELRVLSDRYVSRYIPYEENIIEHMFNSGAARGSVVVKALCYRLQGRGFDTR